MSKYNERKIKSAVKKIKECVGKEYKNAIEEVANDYYGNYDSEENVLLRDYLMQQVLRLQPVANYVRNNPDLSSMNLLHMNFYEIMHLAKSKKMVELQNCEELVDRAVIETKAYLQKDELRNWNDNSSGIYDPNSNLPFGNYLVNGVQNFIFAKPEDTLDSLLISARYFRNSGLLRRYNISLFGEDPSISKNISRTLMDLYHLTPEIEKNIMQDPKKLLILEKVYASMSEFKYEKRYLDHEIEALRKKFPELEGDKSKSVLVYRSGIIGSDGNISAKNRYEEYDELEHIQMGSKKSIETPFISVTESSLVLPVYNLSNRDSRSEQEVPMIIDIRKIYELLLKRQKELETTDFQYDGESDLLEILADEIDYSDDIHQYKLIERLEKIDLLESYEKRLDLPEGFFDREEIPTGLAGQTRNYAFSSAELLFKSSIPQEAVTVINPMDVLVSLSNIPSKDNMTSESTKIQEIKNDLLKNIVSKKLMPQAINEAIANNPDKFGLNNVEAEFLERFYIQEESTSNYLHVPALEDALTKDEKDKVDTLIAISARDIGTLAEKNISIDNAGNLKLRIISELEAAGVMTKGEIRLIEMGTKLKDIDALRYREMEMGFRTDVIRKLLSNDDFLDYIGIDLKKYNLSKEAFMNLLGNLVQVSTEKPVPKHARYDRMGAETVTENQENEIYKMAKDRAKVKGIISGDGLVFVTSEEFASKLKVDNAKTDATVRNAKTVPEGLETDLQSGTGTILSKHYYVTSDTKQERYGGPDIRYSKLNRGMDIILPFGIAYRSKTAADKLRRTAMYFLREDRQNIEQATK